MIRYSTPTIEIETDIDMDQVDGFWVTFKQNENILRKRKSECAVNGKNISITLTQEETAMFKAYEYVQIQIRWIRGGKASGSNIEYILFSEVLENEVIDIENSN